MAPRTGLPRVRHLRWPARLVVAGAALVAVSFALNALGPVPLLITTLGALVGGTAFVLGVSASVSEILQRDGNGDSDFYR